MLKRHRKKLIWGTTGLFILIIVISSIVVLKTIGRTQIQFNIHQDKEIIYLSTFAEPPQFAIWLEDPDNHKCQTVFVTRRTAIDDWEGKASVPVSLPRWAGLFKVNDKGKNGAGAVKEPSLIVTGATPKDDYFSVRAEVKPGSKWVCWIEMNLAGDFNEAFPEQDTENYEVDEFSCGQPALLYKSEITAEEGLSFNFELVGQSIWENGVTSIEPVSPGVTSAKKVFDKIFVEIIRPKPKIIDKNKIEG